MKIRRSHLIIKPTLGSNMGSAMVNPGKLLGSVMTGRIWLERRHMEMIGHIMKKELLISLAPNVLDLNRRLTTGKWRQPVGV
jgi:hypothetical protein